MIIKKMYDSYHNLFTDLKSEDFFTCVQGSKTFMSEKIFSYEEGKKYQIDVDVKSFGDVDSMVYLAVACYKNENPDSFIYSHETCVVPESDVIIKHLDSNKIYVKPTSRLSNWHPSESEDYQRLIGFYFDGITDHLPDYVLKSYGSLTSNCITLSDGCKIPTDVVEGIKTGTTVIRNHCGTCPHVYPFSGKVKRNWVHISKIVSGLSWTNEDNCKHFRTGTKYFKIGLVANYQQEDDAILAFKNFKISHPLE